MLACRVGRKLGGRMFCLVSIAFEVVALDFEAACAFSSAAGHRSYLNPRLVS